MGTPGTLMTFLCFEHGYRSECVGSSFWNITVVLSWLATDAAPWCGLLVVTRTETHTGSIQNSHFALTEILF